MMIEGTKQALAKAGGFEVVGEASNGAQVLPLVRRLKPDLVLLDLRMPQMDGLTCLGKIRKEFPDMKVAILSVSQEPDLIQSALKRGANAYIVKTVDPDDLAAALRQTVEGTVFTTAGVSDDPGERAAKQAGLTERELVIVRAVARGLSNEASAKELWVAEQTERLLHGQVRRSRECQLPSRWMCASPESMPQRFRGSCRSNLARSSFRFTRRPSSPPGSLRLATKQKSSFAWKIR